MVESRHVIETVQWRNGNLRTIQEVRRCTKSTNEKVKRRLDKFMMGTRRKVNDRIFVSLDVQGCKGNEIIGVMAGTSRKDGHKEGKVKKKKFTSLNFANRTEDEPEVLYEDSCKWNPLIQRKEIIMHEISVKNRGK
jgi:hypothetical protein